MTTQTITSVPLLDLQAQYEPIKEDVKKAILDVFDSKQFIQGPKVIELEKAVAEYANVPSAIGVSSGTDALVVALMTMGIGQGDEVITTPFTFFATVGSIVRVGATPVFVDIDRETYNIDPALIEAKITDKTKAIMPVHIFGQMADMDPIMAIAKKHDLLVIEDAAQAIGSSYTSEDGTTYRAGAMGDVGCFSFFPSKNLGCCGDGGMVVTKNVELGERIRLFRTHGAQKKYYHDFVGGNFRLDPMQAAVLLVKLPFLESQHAGRRKNAAIYNEQLTGASVPSIHEKCDTIYNQYTVRSTDRDALQERLTTAKVGNAIYYPVPLHLQNCFSELGYKEGDCPEAESAANEVLSIPVFTELSKEQLEYVVDVING
ncbi:DegT/DnrJ/EryC1/StrS family aminotransferase [bacterium]|jgi:dTDP-4-amino-4,6-dideoxygalactose transaminase|nr:DegT/DnrJ/EryC1/StrS family aminotransferase [bacterium]